MHLPSWTTLSAPSTLLLTELLARYRPHDMNAFELSDRTAAQLGRCARNTARKALEQLEDRGWLVVVKVGCMFGPKSRRAAVYALTAYRLDDGRPASRAFLRWKPQPVQRLILKPSTDQVHAVNSAIQHSRPVFDDASPDTPRH
jgi:hypothetical protein